MKTYLSRVLRLTLIALLAFSTNAFALAEHSASGTISTQNVSTSEKCTANSCVELDITDRGTVSIQVSGTYTGALTLRRTNDGITWSTVSASSTFTNGAGTQTATVGSGVTGTFAVSNVAGFKKIQVTALAAVTGSATVTIYTAAPGGSGGSSGGGGGAVTVSDGSDAALGTTTDSAATAGGAGTVSAKLRLATSQLDAINTNISATNTQLPASLGIKTAANSMSIAPASDAVFAVSGGSATATSDATRMAIDERDGLVVASASVTSATTIVSADTIGYGSIIVNLTAAGSGTVTYQTASDSGFTTALQSVACLSLAPSSSSPAGYGSTATAAASVICPITNRYFRAQVTAYTSGTFTADMILRKATHARPLTYAVIQNNVATQSSGTIGEGSSVTGTNPVPVGLEARTSNIAALTNGAHARLKGTTAGALLTKPFSIPEADWQYAAASSGIVNTTTAVTVKGAAAAGIRNYVTGLCISTATLGGATEFAIRDGAGGTVLFRTQLQTTALPMTCHSFHTPLRGTAATLLEIVTLTGVTGGVYANLQGYEAP